MVPGVGGWYRACVVTVQRVPSPHQALLAELVNETMATARTLLSPLSFVCVFVFALSIKLLSPCLTTSNTCCTVFILFRAFAHVQGFASQHYAFCGRTEGGGGLCYQFILCGLGYKKHPVLWLWKKKPVFNFWETHKSLSLLSYWLRNWKQMLHSFPLSFWTGQL